MRFVVFVLSAALAVLNTLLLLRLSSAYYQASEIQIAAGIILGVAIVFPFALTLALSGLLKKLRFGTRFVGVFALLHAGVFGALLKGAQMGLEDASIMFAKLTKPADTRSPELPKPATEPAEKPVAPVQPVETSSKAAPKAKTSAKTVFYRYEEGDSVHFAKSLEDVPMAYRAHAQRVEMEPVKKPQTPAIETPADRPKAPIEQLNAYRKMLGLSPVASDATLAAAAQKHADYIEKNYGHTSLKGLGMHEEQSELPGYSTEGALSAKRAVIAVQTGPRKDPIATWMGTFFHRLPLIRPTLSKVGYGAVQKERSIFVLDAGDTSGTDVKPQVTMPRDGQEGVPTHFSGNEVPNPIPADEDGQAGYPITIVFAPGRQVKNVAVSFERFEGPEVDHYLSTPQAPVVSGHQGNAICLIAHDPLQALTRYEVRVFATVDGRAFEKTIRFKTR